MPHLPHGRPGFIHDLANRLAHILAVAVADISAWNEQSSARVQQRHERVSQAARHIARKIRKHP